ncbi:MAG: UDP-N-acetylmuramoyl-L-alanyl-D-glutamate--2,6-diaminopimelate ligase [Clostridia bacterium]|jgi:UDP-N-acetylmuramyl-tripeptide synthetase|nr:UDP-N-acetylmuramoyl-L-alanyl-D-glutamate--2,6-diaminopimelate ligase [Clostridia bacterium]
MKEFSISTYVRELEENNLLINTNCSKETGDVVVKKVSYNSNDVTENTLFVCKGAGFKEEYLDMAIEKGAVAYISQKDYHKDIPCIMVSNAQKALSLTAIKYYNNPQENLKLIGITGTKGKTTTANFVKSILDDYLRDKHLPEAGIITTDSVFDGKNKISSNLTTPESLELQKYFFTAVNNNTQYMVVEVSSQALKYGRVHGVCFDVGVFLNISEDHISDIEHTDYNDYFTSKLKLFNNCITACVNLNSDEVSEVLAAAQKADRVMTFGIGQAANVCGYNILDDAFEPVFYAKTDLFSRKFNLKMSGIFNVENALAAIAVANSLGIPEKYIYSGLSKAKVNGRMDKYTSKNGEKVVVVDYAHNKLSFNRLYDSVQKQYPGHKIITVFGCPGEKAITRRRDLGLISGLRSNKIIITMEDPGTENIREICEEIAQYVKQNNNNYEIVEDRTEAIRRAILLPEPNTVVLITGKGDERYQRIGKKTIKYPSDVENAIRFLEEYETVKRLKQVN